jgi:hypothetical protein
LGPSVLQKEKALAGRKVEDGLSCAYDVVVFEIYDLFKRNNLLYPFPHLQRSLLILHPLRNIKVGLQDMNNRLFAVDRSQKIN